MNTIEEVIKEFGIENIADHIIGNHFDEVISRLEDDDIIRAANDKLSDSQKVDSFVDAFELNDLDPSEEDAMAFIEPGTIAQEAKNLNKELLDKNPSRFINELLCDHFSIAYTTDKRVVLSKLHELFKVVPARCNKSSFCSDFMEDVR